MLAYGMASSPLTDILPPATPIKGSPKAPVLIVEFSDFTCGYCGKFFRETLPALQMQYFDSGKVRFAYRDYPRDEGGWGLVAAHAARCAGEQGKFWEMHDKLFQLEARFGKGILMQIARDLRLKQDVFSACMDSRRHIEAIMADKVAGTKLGFRGTPGFLLVRTDGTRLMDPFVMLPGAVPYDRFRSEIDRLLKKR